MYQITVSDLHLGEGILYEDGSLNPLEDFFHDKNFYKFLRLIDQKYKSFFVCLNLLGDIFDPAQVRYENKLIDPPHEEAAITKIKKIIKGHPIFFESLEFWTKKDRPVHLFMGNHDVILAWPKVQKMIKKIISPLRPNLVEILFDKIYKGTYFAHGNLDLFSRLNKDNLFTELPNKIKIINLPRDYVFQIGVVNPLKLFNKYVSRMAMHRHAVLFRDAIFRNWKMVFLASSSWLRVLFKSVSDFKDLGSILFTTFWNVVMGDSVEKYAIKILKEKKIDAVVFGHTHGSLIKKINKQWYANTGTWAMRFRVKPEEIWRKILFFMKPKIERQDKLTYVLTKHRDERTTEVELKEFFPNSGVL